MNKILVVFLLSYSVGFAKTNCKDLPKEFLQTFNVYKKYIIKKDSKKLYDMQLPYFRYLNKFKDFKYYINARVPVKDMKIVNIEEKDEKNIKINVGLKLKNKKDMTYLTHYWYKIKDKYYILTKDEFIFMY